MVFSVSFKNHRKRETGQTQTSVGCMTSCVEFLENANKSLMLKASQWLHKLETGERSAHGHRGPLERMGIRSGSTAHVASQCSALKEGLPSCAT